MKASAMQLFPLLCQSHGIPAPTPEHPFALELGRKWRFDWAWVNRAIALEIEGGAWIGGRHNRGSGFVKDLEKYNTAALLGWRIFRCLPKQVESGEVFEFLRVALK